MVKPYTLIAELKLIPNSSGIIEFNVADLAKDQIEIFKNDIQKDTLPNNLDAFVGFISAMRNPTMIQNGYGKRICFLLHG